MAEERITRKNLWLQLRSVNKRKVWLKAIKELGLNVTTPSGGTSHQYAIRLPGFQDDNMKGHLFNLYEDRLRKDVCEICFKILLDNGFTEDQIWKALRMLD